MLAAEPQGRVLHASLKVAQQEFPPNGRRLTLSPLRCS